MYQCVNSDETLTNLALHCSGNFSWVQSVKFTKNRIHAYQMHDLKIKFCLSSCNFLLIHVRFVLLGLIYFLFYVFLVYIVL